MRLRARVQRVTGATKHHEGAVDDGEGGQELPAPTWVEIQPDDGAFFLFHLDADGETIADTWHQSLEEAKEQAMFEFEIDEGDWEEMESGTS